MELQPSVYVPVAMAVALSGLLAPISWNLIWPAWKRYGKLAFSLSVAVVLAIAVGWWSLIFIIGHPLIGFAGHIWWCRKHGFDWRRVDPEQYRESQAAWVKRLKERQSR